MLTLSEKYIWNFFNFLFKLDRRRKEAQAWMEKREGDKSNGGGKRGIDLKRMPMAELVSGLSVREIFIVFGSFLPSFFVFERIFLTGSLFFVLLL